MAEIIATNVYRQELAARAVSGAASLVPYKVTFGTGIETESPEDDELDIELFSVTPDSVNVDGVTLTIVASYDYDDAGSSNITEVGVFADNSGTDILLGRKVFDAVTINPTDTSEFHITFTY